MLDNALTSPINSTSMLALPMMQAEHEFSWLQGFVIPILFTLFGAAFGFFASQLRDDRNARRAKASFLRAIGMELDALRIQLDASLQEVNERVDRGGSVTPRFAGVLRTSVFASQLGKLRDIADPLLIEVVHFYSDLGTLQQAFEIVNDLGAEYNRAPVPSGEKEAIRRQVASGLRVLQEQISGFAKRLGELRAKLPPVERLK
jgi:hypothetical protein